MKASVGVCVVFVLALLGFGSAIKCYHCKDYSGSCSKIRDCYYDDACVSVYERGGDTYRQCIKYSECERSNIAEKFPRLSSFKYSCCTSDLCNTAAPMAVSSHSVVGILLSLALFWWGVL
ncbi:CD59 glycoprotein [Pimephales promelas]|uniref:CD59 glycoprotein n=1 Tax=Pimephales promelas TaxID=90988 RepID=UPI001955F371|nr:CD59 glycoprotein [Pimephales promelas]KAG1971754.1 CD59 glycoprotein preproprotein [Pimephales promelas]KAG1971755.1 CD59 glycoprotein preproprotein [Pimephales promelas]